jgi:predicted hydrocarbon binding protein
MTAKDRYLRYSKGELGEVKGLYESVMSYAAHGMFYRTGRIFGKRIADEAKGAGDLLKGAERILRSEGWLEAVEFNGNTVTVRGSIEAGKSQIPTCHMLRGVITRLYEERDGCRVHCQETACESSGASQCTFKISKEAP